MGNSITSNYNASQTPSGTGGCGNLWELYPATKKATKEPVTIFLADKTQIAKHFKKEKEEVYNLLKKEVKALTKLKHPSILNIIDPLMEDSKFIAFATEPVSYSAWDILSNPKKSDLIPSELELKVILRDLLEAISFTHSNARLVNLSLSPENLYFATNGKIKLGGYIFSSNYTSELSEHHINLNFKSTDNVSYLFPNLVYSAPEITKELKYNFKSDIFSLGAVMYSILQASNNNHPINYIDIPDPKNINLHKDYVSKLKGSNSSSFKNISPQANEMLRHMLSYDPNDRLNITDYLNFGWLNDPMLKTIDYLNNLIQKDVNQQCQFLEGLLKVLPQFNSKVLFRKIFPKALESMVNPKVVAKALPIIFYIIEKDSTIITKEYFKENAWPYLDKVCRAKEISAYALFILINGLDVLIKVCPISEFQASLIPLYEKALDCNVLKIQTACLTKLPAFARQIEYATLKSRILPKILNMAAASSSSTTIKTLCISSLQEFASLFDSKMYKDSIIPVFDQIMKSETDGKLCISMLKCIEASLKQFSYKDLGMLIIPIMLKMSVNAQLTKSQFSEIISKIKIHLDSICSIRTKELQDIEENSNEIIKEENPSKNSNYSKNSQISKKEEENDNFDFLSQLGASIQPPKSQFSPDYEEKEIKNQEYSNQGIQGNQGNQGKKEDWDLMFNMNNEPKKNEGEFDFFSLLNQPTQKAEEKKEGPLNLNNASKEFHNNKMHLDSDLKTSNKASNPIIPGGVGNISNIWKSEVESKQESQFQNVLKPKPAKNSQPLFEVDFKSDNSKFPSKHHNKNDLNDDPFSELDKDSNLWGEFNEPKESKEYKATIPTKPMEIKEQKMKKDNNIKIPQQIDNAGKGEKESSKPMVKKIEEDFFSDLIDK